jgi:hypothetical protein
MPPDQLSMSLWERALGFLRNSLDEFSRRVIGGIFAGSLAAAAAAAARAIFVRPWTVTYITIAATMVEAVTVGRPHSPRP